MRRVNAAPFGGHIVAAQIVQRPAETGKPLYIAEQNHRNDDAAPNEPIKLMRRANYVAEDFRAGDAENAVRAAGQAENVINQGDPHDFADADCDHAQIIAAQMDNRAGNDGGEHSGGEAGHRQQPENRNAVARVENRGGVRADRVKGGVA